MINSATIQSSYNDLYKCLRNYLWDFSTVIAIAALEIACYEAIPDISNIQMMLNTVKQSCYHLFRDDSELEESFNDFADLLSESSDVFKKLHKVEEVVSDENQ